MRPTLIRMPIIELPIYDPFFSASLLCICTFLFSAHLRCQEISNICIAMWFWFLMNPKENWKKQFWTKSLRTLRLYGRRERKVETCHYLSVKVLGTPFVSYTNYITRAGNRTPTSSNARTTDTQWRHKSKKSENFGRCSRQNMLRPYLKLCDWDLIFGRAVKAIFFTSRP